MNSLSTELAMWLIVAMSFFGGSALASTGLPAAVEAGALRVGGGCPGGAIAGGGANLGGAGGVASCPAALG